MPDPAGAPVTTIDHDLDRRTDDVTETAPPKAAHIVKTEPVQKGQGVAEIDSDKASMEVPAPEGGVLSEHLETWMYGALPISGSQFGAPASQVAARRTTSMSVPLLTLDGRQRDGKPAPLSKPWMEMGIAACQSATLVEQTSGRAPGTGSVATLNSP